MLKCRKINLTKSKSKKLRKKLKSKLVALNLHRSHMLITTKLRLKELTKKRN